MFDPRCVQDDREFDGWKEVQTKATMFAFGPGETGIMVLDEVVHKGAFFGPEKFSGMIAVYDIFAL
jgi:hypothetical protein